MVSKSAVLLLLFAGLLCYYRVGGVDQKSDFKWSKQISVSKVGSASKTTKKPQKGSIKLPPVEKYDKYEFGEPCKTPNPYMLLKTEKAKNGSLIHFLCVDEVMVEIWCPNKKAVEVCKRYENNYDPSEGSMDSLSPGNIPNIAVKGLQAHVQDEVQQKKNLFNAVKGVLVPDLQQKYGKAAGFLEGAWQVPNGDTSQLVSSISGSKQQHSDANDELSKSLPLDFNLPLPSLSIQDNDNFKPLLFQGHSRKHQQQQTHSHSEEIVLHNTDLSRKSASVGSSSTRGRCRTLSKYREQSHQRAATEASEDNNGSQSPTEYDRKEQQSTGNILQQETQQNSGSANRKVNSASFGTSENQQKFPQIPTVNDRGHYTSKHLSSQNNLYGYQETQEQRNHQKTDWNAQDDGTFHSFTFSRDEGAHKAPETNSQGYMLGGDHQVPQPISDVSQLQSTIHSAQGRQQRTNLQLQHTNPSGWNTGTHSLNAPGDSASLTHSSSMDGFHEQAGTAGNSQGFNNMNVFKSSKRESHSRHEEHRHEEHRIYVN